ncbi:MAG: S9 family peptidase, partial [Rubrivivax sp.]|nr:S9 family peptidase [Rubrivivax sp.]
MKFRIRFAAPWRRAVRAGAALALLIAAAAVVAQPARLPPVEDYVRDAYMAEVVISPSGEHVAMLLATPRGRRVAATMPLDVGEPTIVGAFADADVTSVRWVNDRRLVFEAFQPGYLVERDGAGTFAVDVDGRHRRELIGWRRDNEVTGSRITRRGLTYGWFVHGTLDDGSDDVLVRYMGQDRDGDPLVGRIARLNTRNGRMTPLTDGAPGFGYAWLLDARGVLRIVAVQRDGRHRIHWRAPGSDDWRVVLDQDALAADRWRPRFLQDEHTLVVEGRASGRDTTALHAMDLRSGRLEAEPMVAIAGFDLDATLELDRQRREVVGLHTRAADRVSVWFDDRLAGIQQAVDAALPDRVNKLGCGRCLSTRHFIVHSFSDRHPGEYLHYDHERQSVRPLGRHRPWIDEAAQGRRSFHRVTARDGLSLPVYVTHPAGLAPADLAAGTKPTPLPAVVMVHGGPWLRGHTLAWNAEAQFLASRGWRVLEVEFRGSTGYGWRHFHAGWKQWGTAMQDDLADALAWAVAEGLVDAKRVCIYGYSYGGYAALMSPIRHPGLYRCAVSAIGVTDPTLIYTAKWGDATVQSKRYSLPVLVGDPATEGPLLDAASPLKRVAELKVPVLLAYGGEDRRVPREHAERFLRAARSSGLRVEPVI